MRNILIAYFENGTKTQVILFLNLRLTERPLLWEWFEIKKKIKNNNKKSILFVTAFSTKVLIGDTIFTSPTEEGTSILRGHPSHTKV